MSISMESSIETETLVTAELAAFWVETMAAKSKLVKSGEAELDKELECHLLTAAASLLRWRIVVGEKIGVLTIPNIQDWEEDELD